MRPGFTRFITAFLAVAFAFFGIEFFLLHLNQFKQGKASEAWIPVQAIVQSTEYEVTSYGRRISNSPEVTYEYIVAGHKYVSNVFSFGSSISSSNIFEDYPKGRSIFIYYNPNRPGESVIHKGVGIFTIRGLMFAAMILGFSCIFVLYVLVIEFQRISRHGR